MNWSLIRIELLVALLSNAFLIGRMSLEFNGRGTEWAMLFFILVTVISCLIRLAAGELVRDKPKGKYASALPPIRFGSR